MNLLKKEKKENAKKVKEERRRKNVTKHLGKTANGDRYETRKYDIVKKNKQFDICDVCHARKGLHPRSLI